MASARKIKTTANEEVQLQLLYGDDSRFKYWESHLFNEVYLRRDLPEKHADKWGNTEDLSFQHFLNTLRNLAAEYKDRDKELSNWSETETINNWVKHVLDGLGWKNNCTGVQNPFLEETSFRYDGKTYRTDILIVDHPKEKHYVNQVKGDDKLVEARNSVIMPVEVKYWQRLEEFRQGRKEEKKRRDNEADELEKTSTPNEQTVQYMDMLKKGWGILTDGAKWRLFNAELSIEDANRYYEFNLFSLVESINTQETEVDRLEVTEAAKYFYHFFSKETFRPKDEGEESFVEEVLRYSKKYVNKVEEDLKDRFVKAMNVACNGFFKAAAKQSETQDLGVIRNVAESTLFNILFIKSLESRGVLPMNSTDYKKISLSNILDKIERFDPDKDDMLNIRELDRAFKKGNGNSFSYDPTGNQLHDRIHRLTLVLHDGSGKKDNFGFEIAGFKESVFSTNEWSFFKNCKLSNDDWVRILFQLGYAESESLNRKYQQIPYSYFTPRQLGSIYESFLEFKIDRSAVDMIFEKRQWKEADLNSKKYKNSKLPKVRKGELFFSPDNEDRKATGSYYTPDNIVLRIVKDTLEPLVRKQSSAEILKMKICDPAMGSGHFLCSALGYLTKQYLSAKVDESAGDLDLSPIAAKRLLLKDCIYGVDLNPRAVKLAKLSLWLETAALGESLEDLGDQLKTGNSLIKELKGYKFNFNWQEEFPNVFSSGGFDAVVGNPPYIDSEIMVATQANERMNIAEKYEVAKGNWDLYVPFFELSLNLLKDKGRVGLIVPNKWLAADYATSLRKFISTKTEQLIDCSGIRIFEDAGNNPVIWYADNSKKTERLIVTKLVTNEENLFKLSDLGSTWGILISDNPILIANLEKITSKVSNYFSVESPCTVSEAYEVKKILEDRTYDKSKHFKFINTGTIDPFESLWGKKPTTYIKDKYDTPVVDRNTFKKKFPKRYEQSSASKIIISGMRYFECYLDLDGNCIAGKSTVMVRENEDREQLVNLCGLFNSNLVSYYLKQLFKAQGIDGGVSFSPNIIRSIPLKAELLKDKSFRKLVMEIIQVVDSKSKKYEALLAKLNTAVYAAYGVSNADQKHVESYFADEKKVDIEEAA
jgi:hypothetical protein